MPLITTVLPKEISADTLYQEFRLSSKPEDDVFWVAGFNFYHSDSCKPFVMPIKLSLSRTAAFWRQERTWSCSIKGGCIHNTGIPSRQPAVGKKAASLVNPNKFIHFSRRWPKENQNVSRLPSSSIRICTRPHKSITVPNSDCQSGPDSGDRLRPGQGSRR